ncbi:MAG TPA: phosphatase PAP2 family protein [Myxococcota bacterium]|nr:phosphatase PAP2 family protein [Myxococcota bacterium]HRY95715.1 phosphatase PAP2 family protein [Myxococcota bacterium]HSA23094.1 phosphatase PAP2 family protein [Myxococcota bacterium]
MRPGRNPGWLPLALGLALLAGRCPAAADPPEPPGRSPFELDLALDLSLLGVAGAAWAVPYALSGDWSRASCGAHCDPAGLNALDRTVVGNRSPLADSLSNAFVGVGVALPFALDLLDVLVSDTTDGLAGFGVDALVLAEALAVQGALNQAVKLAVRRPRPYAYDLSLTEEERTEDDAGLSFYSAHTSLAFCAATAYSTLFSLRHPDSGWVVPVWLATHALAASTAYLRVHAGKHFWTDVIAGALLGSGVGALIPLVHRRSGGAQAAAPEGDAEPGLRLEIAPLLLPGGGGLVLGLR